jgi:hypothetical protein
MAWLYSSLPAERLVTNKTVAAYSTLVVATAAMHKKTLSTMGCGRDRDPAIVGALAPADGQPRGPDRYALTEIIFVLSTDIP